MLDWKILERACSQHYGSLGTTNISWNIHNLSFCEPEILFKMWWSRTTSAQSQGILESPTSRGQSDTSYFFLPSLALSLGAHNLTINEENIVNRVIAFVVALGLNFLPSFPLFSLSSSSQHPNMWTGRRASLKPTFQLLVQAVA